MKRLTLTLALVGLLLAPNPGVAYLEATRTTGDAVSVTRVMTNAGINATATAESTPLRIVKLGTMESLFVQVTSVDGAPDIKIQYALSLDDTTYTDYALYDPLVTSSATEFTDDPEGLNPVDSPPLFGNFVKFKVTGLAGNQTDTQVNLWFVGRGTNR
jgi:hypothetical protein